MMAVSISHRFFFLKVGLVESKANSRELHVRGEQGTMKDDQKFGNPSSPFCLYVNKY